MTPTNLAKRLLDWNKNFLKATGQLTKEKIAEVFADSFTVVANGKTYEANYDNYFDFLNGFRESISSINYECDTFITAGKTVVIPMVAQIVRLDDSLDIFSAILILQFNEDEKVVLWKEVYVKL